MDDDLHELLVSAGLGRVADVIVREAQPSILLTSSVVEDEETLPLGLSKLGGSPDVPSGFLWPDYQGFPLPFIAQVNLAEIAPHDVQRTLPTTGILYFFYSYDHHRIFMLEESADMWRVCYFEDSSLLQRMSMPQPLPKYTGPFRPCSLNPVAVTTFAPYDPYPDRLEAMRQQFAPVAPFTDMEIEAYKSVRKRFAPPDWGRHRILGYGDGVQYDMPFSGWTLLLQVDSDDNADIMWGDVGTIYFMIAPDDLARCDFRNIRFDEQCG